MTCMHRCTDAHIMQAYYTNKKRKNVHSNIPHPHVSCSLLATVLIAIFSISWKNLNAHIHTSHVFLQIYTNKSIFAQKYLLTNTFSQTQVFGTTYAWAAGQVHTSPNSHASVHWPGDICNMLVSVLKDGNFSWMSCNLLLCSRSQAGSWLASSSALPWFGDTTHCMKPCILIVARSLLSDGITSARA